MGGILVTGGAGYVGSAVVELLIERGAGVVVTDNLTQGHRGAVPAGVPLVEADLKDRDAVARLLAERRPEAVVHLAAVSVVGQSVEQPLRYYRENVVGLLNLLDAMREAGVARIVFSSTASVYGIPERVPITEDAPVRPINPYGWTKLLGEQILADAAAAHGLGWVALRYFNVAGATERVGEMHHPETHLLPRLLDVAAGAAPAVEIYGTDYPTPDGTCIRDYIHIADLAEAHLAALERTRTASGIYNLGNSRGYSVREVIRMVEQVTAKKLKVVERPRRAGDATALVASRTRARAELGWQPRRDLEEIVRSAWQWRERHPKGYQA